MSGTTWTAERKRAFCAAYDRGLDDEELGLKFGVSAKAAAIQRQKMKLPRIRETTHQSWLNRIPINTILKFVNDQGYTFVITGRK